LFGSQASADVDGAFKKLKTMRNDLFHGASLDPEKTNVRASNYTERCFEQGKKIVDTLHEVLVQDTSRCCDEHTKAAVIEAKEQLQTTLNEYMEHKMMVNRDREMCKSLTDADAMLVARYAVHHSRGQLEGDSPDAHRWAKFICVALAGRINIEKEEHLEPDEWMTRMQSRATTLASEDKGQSSANQTQKEHLQKGETEHALHEENARLRKENRDLRAGLAAGRRTSQDGKKSHEKSQTLLREENIRLQTTAREAQERLPLQIALRSAAAVAAWKNKGRSARGGGASSQSQPAVVTPARVSSASMATLPASNEEYFGDRFDEPEYIFAEEFALESPEKRVNIGGTFSDLDVASRTQDLAPAEREWVHQEIEKYEQEEAQERQEAHENVIYLMHQQQLQAAEHQLLQDMEQQQYQQQQYQLLQDMGLQGRRAYSA
jgi:hypothetical protein